MATRLSVVDTGTAGNARGRRSTVAGRDGSVDAWHALPALPMGASFTVRRTDLLRDIVRQAREAGVVLVVAPEGFGKTALLIQYAEEVQSDPLRSAAILVDAAGCASRAVVKLLDDAAARQDPAKRPLIALDNIGPCSEHQARAIADAVRGWRSRGYELVLSCTPDCRNLISQLSDAVKVNAQALKVRPREYSVWMRTFSIGRTVDVYRLAQGIPSLIAALTLLGQKGSDGSEVLDRYVSALYQSVLRAARGEGERMVRAAGLMLLLGEGSVDDIERCGPPLAPEVLVRLTHDYPVFGYDATTRRFSCLGIERKALDQVRGEIAASYPALAKRAVRILLRVQRVDDAVSLAQDCLDVSGQLQVIAQHPIAFSCAGYARYVADALDAGERAGRLADLGTGAVVARYVALLMLGDFKLAATMAETLRARAQWVVQEVSASDWAFACALAELWGTYEAIALPRAGYQRRSKVRSPEAGAVHALADALGRLMGPAARGAHTHRRLAPRASVELDVPYALLRCAELLNDVALDCMDDLDERDEELEDLARRMLARQLVPLQMLLRLAISMRRLFAGAPVTDERAFTDAGTMAIRLADQPLQLLCMMLEGWQNLSVNQMVNAQFRGQQVLRLAASAPSLMRSWSQVLERAAHLVSSSHVTVCEEAEMLDLARRDCTPADAWSVALALSAARFDGELAAWYSLHKRELHDASMRLPARLAIASMGEAADGIRRLIAPPLVARYLFARDVDHDADPLFQVVEGRARVDTGQFSFRLLGGFTVERNGHIITDTIWRRRKVSVLAARLTLGMGAFVSRRILMEELWPACDYKHARDSLYSALSVLRRALGQVKDGPQYIISQGEGVAVNCEFVVSDVMQVERLARDVLLKHTGITAPQIIEACLKIEQIYQGPLYVPDCGNPAFFVRTRTLLQAKFVDCMLRGIEAALDEGDLTSASWMVDAALGQMPSREDVVRAAMRVYDLGGRRTEVVELYHSHLHYLERQAKGLPEPETRELYEQIINQSRGYGLMQA